MPSSRGRAVSAARFSMLGNCKPRLHRKPVRSEAPRNQNPNQLGMPPATKARGLARSRAGRSGHRNVARERARRLRRETTINSKKRRCNATAVRRSQPQPLPRRECSSHDNDIPGDFHAQRFANDSMRPNPSSASGERPFFSISRMYRSSIPTSMRGLVYCAIREK